MFALWIAFVCAAAVSAKGAVYNNASPENAFKECLVSQSSGSLGYCIGYGALAKLRSFDTSPEFDLVDGLTFTRDEKMYRDGYSVVSESDPGIFVLDSWGQVFQTRTMKWDMAFVHPGLSMRVAPGATGGVLEFVMDPHNTFQQHSLKEASAGRILARQFLVPLLLGFKFNMATLIPVIFGLIALIAKKALVLSKIALVISSAFSLSSLLFTQHSTVNPYGYQPTYNPSFGGQSHHAYRLPDDEYQEHAYRSSGNINAAQPAASSYDDDQLRLYDAELQQAFSREEKKKDGRNFAWSESDKKKKN
ncbi:uncharacterized protein Osi10a [Atheta coriaria]|uniref:uncharacterized protein Osi10a n=1 Tax=Dalotia coriaria TaxID=877792 RepID=UPI0031F36E8D